MALPKLLNSIRWRMLAPTVVLILASNFVIVTTTIEELDTQLIESLTGDLRSEAGILGVQLRASVLDMFSDVAWLRGVPPVQGIIRAEANGGIDPLDQSSLVTWKQRLAIIYTEMLAAKPTRVQIRFIHRSGQELLRVDRYGPGNSIRVVPEPELQDKSQRDYFLAASQLPSGQVYLSEINLNRERGKIMQPPQGVVRVATPIYADSGELYGVLVINDSVDHIFEILHELVSDRHDLRIVNHRGDYLVHPEAGRSFQFDYGRRSNILDDIAELAPLFSLQQQDIFMTTQLPGAGGIVVAKRVHHNPFIKGNFLMVVLTGTITEALQVRENVFQRNSLILGLTLLIAVLGGMFVVRHIAAPIIQMRHSIDRRNRSQPAEPLPLAAPGEIGELARAFDELFENLGQRQSELEREVAERKLAQEQVEHHLEKLAKANEELQQFSYIASHDLQEPLRTVKSFVELLEKNYSDRLDGNGQSALRFIIQSSTRMQELIYGLLNYSRIGVDSARGHVDLNRLLAEVREDLAAKIAEKRATLEFAAMPTLCVQATEIRQLFQNLVSNGLKFSRPDTPPVVKISAKQVEGGWQFAVQDNGIGIEEQLRSRIFLIFQRLHRRDEIEGTGIGLAHCKKIVELHGGRIWVESAPDGGSIFYFTIMDEGK